MLPSFEEITTNTTYIDQQGNINGWDGHGEIECPNCRNLVDVGTGEHGMIESFFCRKCNLTFEIDWEDMFYQ